jgi:hypothetical protein
MDEDLRRQGGWRNRSAAHPTLVGASHDVVGTTRSLVVPPGWTGSGPRREPTIVRSGFSSDFWQRADSLTDRVGLLGVRQRLRPGDDIAEIISAKTKEAVRADSR